MSDFDWTSTLQDITRRGNCMGVIAGDTAGNVYASYPLAEDGNYKYWVYTDPYDATVTKEDGTEETVPVTESANVVLLLSGKKSSIPSGVGIRVNGEKFMHLNQLKEEKYPVKIDPAFGGGDAAFDDSADGVETHEVTLEQVHILKKGTKGLVIVVKGGYFLAAFCNEEDPKQKAPLCAASLAVGMYWAVGPDAA